VNIYLIKHHKNFRAELLHHKIIEQSSSGVEQSHAQYTLRVGYGSSSFFHFRARQNSGLENILLN
jgi:hypothetical protein